MLETASPILGKVIDILCLILSIIKVNRWGPLESLSTKCVIQPGRIVQTEVEGYTEAQEHSFLTLIRGPPNAGKLHMIQTQCLVNLFLGA